MNLPFSFPQIRQYHATVFIGPNGAGKSRLLREIALEYLESGEQVIAVAPTLHDRFGSIRRSKFSFFGARLGRMAAKKAVTAALVKTKTKGLRAFESLLSTLEYTKFDPVLGIRIPKINMENLRRLEESGLPYEEIGELEAALHSWSRRLKERRGEMVRLSMRYHNFDELNSLSFATIAKHESRLKRMKIISGIDYFLLREGEEIHLLNACSGELSIICSLGFIASNIGRNSVIIVDEPENSLHPTWQKDYLKMLFDLFHHYRPTIVISTHSPIVISGAGVEKEGVIVYEIKNGGIERFDHVNLNLEEMYEKLFDLVTPKNHYLSRRAVKLLDEVNEGSLDAEGAKKVLAELRGKSYDDQQIAVIDGIAKLAEKVERKRGYEN